MTDEVIAPVAQKKKFSKGKLIAILILVVLVVAAAVAGVMYMKWYNSPEQQYQRALESGNDAEVDKIISENEELRDSVTVADTLNTKLEELQRSFLEETIEYSAAVAELNRIEAQNVTGTKENLVNVRSYIEALNSSRIAYKTAESFFNGENYAEAISQYEKVIEEDPNYTTAKAKIDACYNSYRTKALTEAEAMVAAGSYETAIGMLESALNVLPNDAQIQEKIILYTSKLSELEISDALANAAAHAEAGDYAAAIRAIEAQYRANTSHYQLSTRYNEYVAAYETKVLAAADALAAERKYDEAIEQLKSAQNLLSASQSLKDKIAALEASKPIPLNNLGFFNGGWSWNEGTPDDPFGSNYSGSTNFTILTDHDRYEDPKTVYAEFHLDGKYELLTGSLVPYVSIQEHATYQIMIYTDDGSSNFQLVYTSPVVSRKTYPFTFEANVSGANFLKITVVLGDESAAILSDLQLWPK